MSRIVVLGDVDCISIQSSNKLLIMLESAPKNCFFLLTTSRQKDLLSTITSRAIKWQIKPPSNDEIKSQTDWLPRSVPSIAAFSFATYPA